MSYKLIMHTTTVLALWYIQLTVNQLKFVSEKFLQGSRKLRLQAWRSVDHADTDNSLQRLGAIHEFEPYSFKDIVEIKKLTY